MTNKYCSVLYTGVTNDLIRRVYEHKNKVQKGFTKKYKVDRLVYYEQFSYILDAIAREKQIKSWSRESKNKLVNTINPSWNDLYNELTGVENV
jgi:putative endonuclease